MCAILTSSLKTESIPRQVLGSVREGLLLIIHSKRLANDRTIDKEKTPLTRINFKMDPALYLIALTINLLLRRNIIFRSIKVTLIEVGFGLLLYSNLWRDFLNLMLMFFFEW